VLKESGNGLWQATQEDKGAQSIRQQADRWCGLAIFAVLHSKEGVGWFSKVNAEVKRKLARAEAGELGVATRHRSDRPLAATSHYRRRHQEARALA